MSDSSIKAVLRAVFTHPVVKLVIAVALVVLAMVLGSAAWEVFGEPWIPGPWEAVFNAIWLSVLVMLAYAAFVRGVERRPVADFARTGAVREWVVGLLLGFGAISLTVGVIALLGGYTVIGRNPASVLIPVLALSISSGVIEEVITRGIVFRLLEEWLGSWAALALSALIFGFMHITNPNSSVLAALAIAIEAGILLGAVYMLTRRLWLAIGLHMAWNFTQGGIYGIAVSGIEMKGLLQSTVQGPALLTGGDFGAEASLPAIVICTALGLWLLRRAHLRGHFVAPSWHRFKTGRPAPEATPTWTGGLR